MTFKKIILFNNLLEEYQNLYSLVLEYLPNGDIF
jgi:hypothetical protein